MEKLETAFGMGCRKVVVTAPEYEGFCLRQQARMANFADNAWDVAREFVTPANVRGYYNEFHRNSPLVACYFVFVKEKFWQK